MCRDLSHASLKTCQALAPDTFGISVGNMTGNSLQYGGLCQVSSLADMLSGILS